MPFRFGFKIHAGAGSKLNKRCLKFQQNTKDLRILNFLQIGIREFVKMQSEIAINEF
jgi:hypothetical protein